MTDRLTEEELAKMETARFLLEPPAPEVVGQLLTEVRRLREENEALMKIALEDTRTRQDLRARLNLYEPPEGERDLTLVCQACGSALQPCECGCGRKSDCPEHGPGVRATCRWKWQTSQRILNGEVSK
jgi:hypothetical protein